MKAWLEAGPDPGNGHQVHYAWPQADGFLPLMDRLSATLTLRFTGVRTCTACGKRVKKFYGQGLCYPCLMNAPEASPCILRPELCEAHLGRGRDVQWERDHHGQEHVVYLSFTGGVKVGVTRSAQVPVRWIDQGAVLAVPIARVPYRQLAGAIEVDLKQHFADRTDWRKMLLLSGPTSGEGALHAAWTRVAEVLDPALRDYLLPSGPLVHMHYPLPSVPPKLVSVQLEKLPEISGKLQGIKGQYLVWADGRVLNVRNHIGYHVEIGWS
ncbi:MAG: DUF2797 domain-containing protein [Flavobacteriales bacterium]|nr:DUF2797 domain-containing protein [Flavobacteriales bacterium]MBP9081166.1 DUF2797 domain-containing protein [Flavobacteriales bacterium]